MLSATLYISGRSIVNRLRRWFKRLREPRYLVGVIIAAVYFYFMFVVRARAARPGRVMNSFAIVPLPADAGVAFATVAFLVSAALSWLVPANGRLLEFSQPEVQFLFPAPLGRRDLIVYRLIRSQLGLLFASLVPAMIFALPRASAAIAFRGALTIWVVMVASRIYFSAVALARSQLRSPDPRLRRIARLPLVVVLAVIAAVGNGVWRAFSTTGAGGGRATGDALEALQHSINSGSLSVMLLPLKVLVQPLFAPDWASYFTSLAGGVVVGVAMMAWLLASDAAFQDAAVDLAEQQQSRPQQARARYRARKTDWTLGPTGRPETAFVWKTTMQILRVVDRRVIIRVVAIVFALALLIVTANRTRGAATTVGMFAVIAAGYTTLMAPQILRLDLRQDFQHLELMKTWPVRAGAIIRGEMAGPAFCLSAIAWGLIGLAFMLSAATFTEAGAAWRVSAAAAGLLVSPALIFAQYALHNSIALIFPAWVPLGAGRPRGFDAMGQRILMLGGTWLGLALMALPGAIAGGILWIAFYRVLGPPVIVAGAVCVAGTIALEILAMTEALAPAYDRLDLLSVERAE
jgi:ABC-2 type transport system permease protein